MSITHPRKLVFGFLVGVRLSARVTIFDASATVSLFKKEKAPGHPGLSPLKRRLLGIALADQIAGQ